MPQDSEQLQKEAVARWQHCLNRHSGLPDAAGAQDFAREMQNRCEGHRRDVLMTFPATVEPQLDILLLEQTMKSVLNTSVQSPEALPSSPTTLPSAAAIQSVR